MMLFTHGSIPRLSPTQVVRAIHISKLSAETTPTCNNTCVTSRSLQPFILVLLLLHFIISCLSTHILNLFLGFLVVSSQNQMKWMKCFYSCTEVFHGQLEFTFKVLWALATSLQETLILANTEMLEFKVTLYQCSRLCSPCNRLGPTAS